MLISEFIKIHKDELLHVYGARRAHEGVTIVGSVESLKELRAALDEAIDGKVGQAYARTNDGEGFRVEVLALDDMSKLILPYDYSDSDKCEPQEEYEQPWQYIDGSDIDG